MNNAIAIAGLTATKIEAMSLDTVLDTLLRYGHPRLSHIGKGWYCCIEMFVSAKGVDFKIASELNHLTAGMAARECLERTAATLNDVAMR